MRTFRLNISDKILLLLCLMYLILYVDRVNISTAAPLIKEDLKLSNTELGFAFSAFAYPYALFQLVGGWLGDTFGARATLGVCGLIVCAATATTGAVGGLASLLAARLALGIGEGAAFPTATRAMAIWTPEANWGFAQGITHSFARIGNAVTPLQAGGKNVLFNGKQINVTNQSGGRSPWDGQRAPKCRVGLRAARRTTGRTSR